MRLLLSILVLIGGLLLGAIPALAEPTVEADVLIYNTNTVVDPCPPNPATGEVTGRCTTTTDLLKDLGERAIEILLFIVGASGIIMIIYSGISYTTAGGDENKVGKARRILVYSILAILIASASYLIFNANIKAAPSPTNPNGTL